MNEKKVGLVYHQDYLLHEHSPTHPERRERLMYTMDQLEEEGIFDFPEIEVFEPRKASRTELLRVHSEEYLDQLAGTVWGRAIDREGETIMQEVTYEQARLAAGDSWWRAGDGRQSQPIFCDG